MMGDDNDGGVGGFDGGDGGGGGASGSEAAAADGARSADGDLNFDDLFSRSPPPPGTTPGAKG